MPRYAVFIKEAVWPFLPERTRNNIKFMTAEELRAHGRQSFDEATVGRLCDAMALNRDDSVSLEQRKQTWACVDPRGRVVPMLA